MDNTILFLLFTLIYAQGRNPYISAFAFALSVFGTNYVLDKYNKQQNVLRLTNLFKKALYAQKK
jgi:hypothetical protein